MGSPSESIIIISAERHPVLWFLCFINTKHRANSSSKLDIDFLNFCKPLKCALDSPNYLQGALSRLYDIQTNNELQAESLM